MSEIVVLGIPQPAYECPGQHASGEAKGKKAGGRLLAIQLCFPPDQLAGEDPPEGITRIWFRSNFSL